MLKLTDYEQKMLDGEFGRYKQLAMQQVVKFANVLGAEELVPITKVHLNMGIPPLDYGVGDDFNEAFRRVYLAVDEKVKFEGFSPECFVQTDGGAVDQYDPKPMGHPQSLCDLNRERELISAKGGTSIVGSCTPYLAGWLPLRGEHFVTTESSNVLFSNAVFGAMGNANGTASCAWAAITGRGPKWGLHIKENRYAQCEFKVECQCETPQDWDVIGYTLGRKLKLNKIPVLTGNFHNVDVIRLKRMFSAIATSSGLEMIHIEGITPEAPTKEIALGGKTEWPVYHITQADYDESFRLLCDEGSAPVQLVSCGCPHYTLQEIRDCADYIQGKKVKEGVTLIFWTNSALREAARLSGYLDTIEAAGATIGTNGCPLVQGAACYKGVTGMAVDAAKQAHYNRSYLKNGNMFYGTMEQCVDAAVSGIWEGKK
ncbi:MAG: aconitase X [Eubacteriales bacterium]|nr:aconitase X [Eubacteriales bacterium]